MSESTGRVAGMFDEPVGSVAFENGDGIGVGVHGEIWSDQEIIIGLHLDGVSVVVDGEEDDLPTVSLPLDRLPEFIALLNRAADIVRSRAADTPERRARIVEIAESWPKDDE